MNQWPSTNVQLASNKHKGGDGGGANGPLGELAPKPSGLTTVFGSGFHDPPLSFVVVPSSGDDEVLPQTSSPAQDQCEEVEERIVGRQAYLLSNPRLVLCTHK